MWNEQDHPRDNDGKFTFKEGGVLKGGIEKTENNEGLLGKILGGYSLGEIKDILFSVISTAAPSIIKTGLTIAQMKNFIKLNNLEKEVLKKIENIKTNKGMAEIKRKSQGDKNNSSNLISLGNSSNNLTNNRIKSKIKETPKDILFASSNTNNQLKLKQDDYKSKLLIEMQQSVPVVVVHFRQVSVYMCVSMFACIFDEFIHHQRTIPVVKR